MKTSQPSSHAPAEAMPVGEFGPADDQRRWPVKQWLAAFLAIFILQVGIIWIVGQRYQSPDPMPVFPTTVYLPGDLKWTELQADSPLVSDAALLPLPNPHGFSASAWLTYEPGTNEFSHWQEPEHWLSLNESALGEGFQVLVDSLGESSIAIADKPLTPTTQNTLVVSNLPLPTASSLLIQGPLAGRKMMLSAEIPSWPHTDILTNSVVRILVDDHGWVFSAALMTSCGLAEADRWALNMSKVLQFDRRQSRNPVETGVTVSPLTVGHLVFRWHTLPPPPPPETTSPPA